jgi:VDE lipocalin domain
MTMHHQSTASARRTSLLGRQQNINGLKNSVAAVASRQKQHGSGSCCWWQRPPLPACMPTSALSNRATSDSSGGIWREFDCQCFLLRLASRATALATAGILIGTPLVPPPPATAADTVRIGTCLLAKCQLQLAQCLGDTKCLQNIVCLNRCNSAEDEAGCQIRCGDLYGDRAVDTFNACAVSEQKCVPQRQDEGLYPVPPDCALDSGFDLASFTGRWYITAGQNELFDTFDCQVRE